MRIIKFRCYSPEEKRWFYGDLDTGYGDFELVRIADWEDGEYHEVDAESVGQYTGCYDSDGREIWEGDILRVIDIVGDTYTGVVVFDEGSFGFLYRKKGDPRNYLVSMPELSAFNKEVKVIGVKYSTEDNKEVMS